MEPLDFRSDTVTRPDPGMRRAIAEAEVGDDVFGDDPTIARLQERVARLLGKEDSLFVPSGTMGNQIAINLHTRPGDQLILEADSHIYHYEAGAGAVLSGLWPTLVAGEAGVLRWEQIEAALHPDDPHKTRPSLVCLENTHNRAGGTILPLPSITEVARGCREHGLKLHLDGARLWNASVATGVPLERWCRDVDTVSVCFSKGLGAPVGSVLAGRSEDIARARRVRKRLGGGMRQAGLLAAACLHALDHNLERLQDDHRNARWIAENLHHPRMRVPVEPQTNILLIDLDPQLDADDVLDRLARRGLLAVAFGAHRLRITTHKDVSREDCERAVEILNALQL